VDQDGARAFPVLSGVNGGGLEAIPCGHERHRRQLGIVIPLLLSTSMLPNPARSHGLSRFWSTGNRLIGLPAQFNAPK